MECPWTFISLRVSPLQAHHWLLLLGQHQLMLPGLEQLLGFVAQDVVSRGEFLQFVIEEVEGVADACVFFFASEVQVAGRGIGSSEQPAAPGSIDIPVVTHQVGEHLPLDRAGARYRGVGQAGVTSGATRNHS